MDCDGGDARVVGEKMDYVIMINDGATEITTITSTSLSLLSNYLATTSAATRIDSKQLLPLLFVGRQVV